MTGTLDILTNLELQCLGLWILLRTSSGNDKDSGILVLTSSGNDCSNMRGSRGGRGGPDPSGKSKSYMRFYGNKHLDPPPGKSWTPPENRISGTFKLYARKCHDNIKGHLQRFFDTYIFQLWYYRCFFYHIG